MMITEMADKWADKILENRQKDRELCRLGIEEDETVKTARMLLESKLPLSPEFIADLLELPLDEVMKIKTFDEIIKESKK